MNVVIIDSDCKKHFPEEETVKALLLDRECQVYYLTPAQLPQVEAGCRCVLLSAMNSGLKKYHRDLIMNNPQVRCWVISIVDVPFKSEQSQLVDSISTTLAEGKVPYSILFDDAKTLTDTAAVCAKPVNPRKTCLVVSENSPLAEQCCQVLAPRLDGWDVVHISDEPEEHYDGADVILAVGSTKGDFRLPAPKYGMGRMYAWVESKGKDDGDGRRMAYETLADQGWSLSSIGNTYTSSLDLESYAWQVDSREVSASTLSNDDNFVIWDAYGLPLRSRDYSDEVIREFLDRLCCFGKLAERF